MRDFLITLSHRPGELADVTNALSLQGVNIKSLAAFHVENHALVRLIPDDVEAARTAFRSANIRYEEKELVTMLLENRAGELTGVLEKKIATTLSQQCSPRHVPDRVYSIEEVPYTLTGKKLEVPVKKLLLGISADKALNKGAIANPLAMNYFIDLAGTIRS